MAELPEFVVCPEIPDAPIRQYFPSIYSTLNTISSVMFPTKQMCVVMQIVTQNGRKIYGPPLNCSTQRPTYNCELFVNRLPSYIDDIALLQSFYRLGMVYEMRLMMQSFTATRGYAFVRYTREFDALAACQLLNFLYVNGNRLNVCRSLGRNRLFIGGIPKRISPQSILAGLKKLFPQMEHCNIYPLLKNEFKCPASDYVESIAAGNRGYAFVTFADHDAALSAKRQYNQENRNMWGSSLRVMWAKTKDTSREGRSFLAELRSFGNIDAHYCYDYSAILRLYCLANGWSVPIVVFGATIRTRCIQYCAILLKRSDNHKCCFILCELSVVNIYDVHILLCEIATKIINLTRSFPNQHYVVRVKHHTRAEIVHQYTDNSYLPEAPINHYFVAVKCIHELDKSLQTLAEYSSDHILWHYKEVFTTPSSSELPMLTFNGQHYTTTYYAIHPKYRNNMPLEFNFNDTEITLLLEKCITDQYPKIDIHAVHSFHHETVKLRVQTPEIHPNYILQYVDLNNGKWALYHPYMYGCTHPTDISVHSFEESLYEEIEDNSSTPL